MHEKVDPRRPNSLHLVGLLISPQDWLCRRAGGNCAGQESGGAIWCGPRAQQGHVSCARRLCSCRPSLAHASTGPHTPCWVPSLDPRFPNISLLAYYRAEQSHDAAARESRVPANLLLQMGTGPAAGALRWHLVRQPHQHGRAAVAGEQGWEVASAAPPLPPAPVPAPKLPFAAAQ